MTHWHFEYPTARKAHICGDCGRRIDPGETYTRGSGLDNGEAWTWKRCAHCSAALSAFDIGGGDDELYWDAFEAWAEDGMAETIPEARAVAGYRHRWRTQSGLLWPIPSKAT